MTIRHMQIFAAVYRQESVTKAAEELHMTQPAVTRAIHEIEQHYGIRLFERMHRRLLVTEAGRELYTYAVHILDAFDQMEKELHDWDQAGVIRIGATMTLGSEYLPGILRQFLKEHPRIAVRAMVDNASRLQTALLSNELDLALIEGTVTEPDLVAEPFAEDRLLLVVPPDSGLREKETVKVSELSAYPLLLRNPGSVGRRLVDSVFAARGLSVEPMLESASTGAILSFVQEGLGISLLPESLVQRQIRSGGVASVPIEDESFQRQNYLVWHRNKHLTASMKELAALCRKSRKQNAPDLTS